METVACGLEEQGPTREGETAPGQGIDKGQSIVIGVLFSSEPVILDLRLTFLIIAAYNDMLKTSVFGIASSA